MPCKSLLSPSSSSLSLLLPLLAGSTLAPCRALPADEVAGGLGVDVQPQRSGGGADGDLDALVQAKGRGEGRLHGAEHDVGVDGVDRAVGGGHARRRQRRRDQHAELKVLRQQERTRGDGDVDAEGGGHATGIDRDAGVDGGAQQHRALRRRGGRDLDDGAHLARPQALGEQEPPHALTDLQGEEVVVGVGDAVPGDAAAHGDDVDGGSDDDDDDGGAAAGPDGVGVVVGGAALDDDEADTAQLDGEVL